MPHRHAEVHTCKLFSYLISKAAFKESAGVYQRKHFHLRCVFSLARMCVFMNVTYYFRCVSATIIIIPLCCRLCLLEADGVRDKQGVPGLSEVVSSGRLPSASESRRIRRSLRGELLVRPALSLPQKVLLQWLRTHLSSASESIQRYIHFKSVGACW